MYMKQSYTAPFAEAIELSPRDGVLAPGSPGAGTNPANPTYSDPWADD